MLVEIGAAPVDCVCKCLGGLSVGSSFYRVHEVLLVPVSQA